MVGAMLLCAALVTAVGVGLIEARSRNTTRALVQLRVVCNALLACMLMFVLPVWFCVVAAAGYCVVEVLTLVIARRHGIGHSNPSIPR